MQTTDFVHAGPDVTVEDGGIHAEEDVAWVALHVADTDAATMCVAQASGGRSTPLFNTCSSNSCT